ncbi:ATP-binding cassette domain-containing protein [Desulfatirhabdium butyrativorans]|uniref:ATP-binding cassette domain-containing protein n=1 Tax=Desulfatirhabdium butyrativorans TaxID=340467 RepID=UPI00040D3FF0|nr:ATP-binding cassette domain-containing protein [Desulfatirhabdium butyrativorans]
MVQTRMVSAPDPPVVDIRSFRKSYGSTAAVRGVDLSMHRGEMFGLIGPDGAGKSTLMKAVAGVLSYDAGMVRVFDLPVQTEAEAEKIKGRIGFMPQGLGLNLYPELSIEENIDFFARLRLVPETVLKERKRELLAITRLEAFRARPMKLLSGGMKQKLGLVCSLIHEPDLIILDEPTTGVDPVSRRDFWAILASLLAEKGTSALISTAYMEEASRFHRIALMHEGMVLAEGEPSEIIDRVNGTLVALRADPQWTAVELLRTCYPSLRVQQEWIQVFVPEMEPDAATAYVRKLLGPVARVLDLRYDPPDLEDVFLELIRDVSRDTTHCPQEIGPSGISISALDRTVADRRERPKPEIAIAASSLVRDFGAFRAVDRVSFEAPYGEIFGLLGANGAGKTTVIKMLTGILRPTAGEGQVAGVDMRRAGRSIKEKIGYMSQAFSLYTDLTVVENIHLYAGIYGLDRRLTMERTAWVLDMAELQEHQNRLSGSLPMGIRQRLALGCALVHQPKVLFLDEPTSGVDPLGRRRLWETFYRLAREQSVAVLVTTHYMSEAEHCDHLALMFAGRIVADATPAAMKAEVEQEAGELLEIDTDNPLAALQALQQSGHREAALYGKRIHLLTRNVSETNDQLATLFQKEGIALLGVGRKPLSMEDVFVYRVLSLEQA